MAKMRVNTAALNLRSAPVTDPNNIILPRGHEVNTINQLDNQTFREVETIVDGQHRQGFAAARFLRFELSIIKERLIQEALAEWDLFKRGAGIEDTSPFFKRIGEYWRAIDIAVIGAGFLRKQRKVFAVLRNNR
jgi:hypothetical protein